ncbi:MAG: 2Fe-2S iron-sulfur cluster-binding protein, partial [Bacteroidota bacterium]
MENKASKNNMISENKVPQNGNVPQAYINDKAYDLLPGETILQFVRRHFDKKAIPTLCDAPNLEPFGSCRVCSVDVALVAGGPVKTMASCHTPASPNTFIYTDSKRIQDLRKNIIELV